MLSRHNVYDLSDDTGREQVQVRLRNQVSTEGTSEVTARTSGSFGLSAPPNQHGRVRLAGRDLNEAGETGIVAGIRAASLDLISRCPVGLSAEFGIEEQFQLANI